MKHEGELNKAEIKKALVWKDDITPQAFFSPGALTFSVFF